MPPFAGKFMSTPPTPPNESQMGYVPGTDPPLKAIKQEYHPYMNGHSRRDRKTLIEEAIDADENALLEFLDAFNAAAKKHTGSDIPPESRTTAPSANIVSQYLSSRGIKSMPVGTSASNPSVVSVFDEGEGPCLVLNGLLSLHPPSNIDIPSCTAGTAAIIATYAVLHAMRANLIGTVVLETISDDESGDQGACRHLLHTDERRILWRGDCMLTSVSCDNTSGLAASCVTHPIATALSNNGQRVMGRRPSIPILPGVNHCRFWSELGTPSFSFGVKEEMGLQGVGRKEWLELVKVLALTGWDYVGFEDE